MRTRFLLRRIFWRNNYGRPFRLKGSDARRGNLGLMSFCIFLSLAHGAWNTKAKTIRKIELKMLQMKCDIERSNKTASASHCAGKCFLRVNATQNPSEFIDKIQISMHRVTPYTSCRHLSLRGIRSFKTRLCHSKTIINVMHRSVGKQTRNDFGNSAKHLNK